MPRNYLRPYAVEAGRPMMRTLIEDADLRVALIVLRPGARLAEPTHRGRPPFTHAPVGSGSARPGSGYLVTLGPAVRHGVEALEERAFLLAIAWPGMHGATGD